MKKKIRWIVTPAPEYVYSSLGHFFEPSMEDKSRSDIERIFINGKIGLLSIELIENSKYIEPIENLLRNSGIAKQAYPRNTFDTANAEKFDELLNIFISQKIISRSLANEILATQKNVELDESGNEFAIFGIHSWRKQLQEISQKDMRKELLKGYQLQEFWK